MNCKLFTMAAATLFMTACGGGGGSGAPSAGIEHPSPVPERPQVQNGKGMRGGWTEMTLNAGSEGRIKWTTDGKYLLALKDYRLMLDGKTYKPGDQIDVSHLNQGLTIRPVTASINMVETDKPTVPLHSAGEMKIYKQNFSVVAATRLDKDPFHRRAGGEDATFNVDGYGGRQTQWNELPDNVSYRYTGQAISRLSNQGVLDYTIDFAAKRGKGSISGLPEFGVIELKDSPIGQYRYKEDDSDFVGVRGERDSAVSSLGGEEDGEYNLIIHGPKAEEIVGIVWMGYRYQDPQIQAGKREREEKIIFGGKRAQ